MVTKREGKFVSR